MDYGAISRAEKDRVAMNMIRKAREREEEAERARAVNLTANEVCVLGLLMMDGKNYRLGIAKYGLDLVRESNGELRRGTIDGLLDRMKARGYIASREPTATARRRYWSTSLGEQAYVFHKDHPRRPWEWWAFTVVGVATGAIAGYGMGGPLGLACGLCGAAGTVWGHSLGRQHRALSAVEEKKGRR